MSPTAQEIADAVALVSQEVAEADRVIADLLALSNRIGPDVTDVQKIAVYMDVLETAGRPYRVSLLLAVLLVRHLDALSEINSEAP